MKIYKNLCKSCSNFVKETNSRSLKDGYYAVGYIRWGTRLDDDEAIIVGFCNKIGRDY